MGRVKFRTGITAVFLSAAMVLATAPPANATALHMGVWGTKCFRGKCIPEGNWIHLVEGTGTQINKHDFSATKYLGKLCNWRIDFFYKKDGRRYHTDPGITYGCTLGAKRINYRVNRHVQVQPYSQACAQLVIDNKGVETSCTAITP